MEVKNVVDDFTDCRVDALHDIFVFRLKINLYSRFSIIVLSEHLFGHFMRLLFIEITLLVKQENRKWTETKVLTKLGQSTISLDFLISTWPLKLNSKLHFAVDVGNGKRRFEGALNGLCWLDRRRVGNLTNVEYLLLITMSPYYHFLKFHIREKYSSLRHYH